MLLLCFNEYVAGILGTARVGWLVLVWGLGFYMVRMCMRVFG